MDSQQNHPDFDSVRNVLRSYVATWNSRRVSGLKSHWDESLPNPVYIAEESAAMTNWPDIEQYWSALDGVDVTIKVSEPQLSRLTDDVITAFYDMHWRIRFEQHAHWKEPIGGNLRVSVVLARRSSAWKIVNYVEAPFASAVQVRKWLERDALG